MNTASRRSPLECRTAAVCRLIVAGLLVLYAGRASAQGMAPGTDSGGFQPHRAYFAVEPFEHFDTQSGQLLLTFTDLVLPGNAGRDLQFVRIGGPEGAGRVELAGYVTSVFGGGFPPPGTPITWEDPGWFLFGAPRLEFGGVTQKQTFFVNTPNTTSQQTIHDSMQTVETVDLYRYNQLTRTLYMPDGRVCQYDHSYGDQWHWYLTECRDPFGNLMFEILRSGTTLTVRQHVGAHTRDVVLTYPEPLHYVGLQSSMTYAGRTWQYAYTSSTLTVTPPVGPGWTFTSSTTLPAWSRVTTPGGGQILYEFSPQSEVHPGSGDMEAETPPGQYHGLALTRRTSTGPDVTEGVWNLSYRFSYEPTGSTTGELHLPWQITITTPASVTHVFSSCLQGFDDNPVSGYYYIGNLRILCEGPAENGYPTIDRYRWTTFHAYPGLELRRIVRTHRDVKNCTSFVPQAGCATHVTQYWEGDQQNIVKIEETSPETPTFKRVTERTYAVMPSVPFFKGHLLSEKVTIAGESFLKTWAPDNWTGFVTAETIGGITTTFAPDAYGNVATATQNGKTTTFTYEWGQVASTQTPAYTVSRTINPDGTIESETQAGRVTAYQYDALGRRTVTQGPGGTTPAITTYNNSTGREVTTTRGTSRVRTTLDGFGRPIRMETGTTSAYAVKTTTGYDAAGRTIFAGVPVAVGAPDVGTQIAYDALSRVVLEAQADGTSRQRTYGRTTVTVRDENNHTSVLTRQMFGDPAEGRITQLVDAAGHTWNYSYNVLGSLTGVSGPGGVTRAWTYDGTSKLLQSETHPESGTVQYTVYDAGGVLKQTLDANGTTVQYGHDNNNRVTQVTATPASGPAQVTTITYEPGSDRRQTTSLAGGASSAFHYDTAGRLDLRTDTIDGKAFLVEYDYDSADNLTRVTYPSGRQVQFEYDAQHRLTRVSNVATSATYADLFTYHPSGAVTGYRAGNGVVTTFGYHPTRQWLSTMVAGQGANRVELGYAYDGAGNISGITDWRGGMTQTFTYDALDRLTQANAPGWYNTVHYAYDAHGNQQTASGGLAYTYIAGRPFHLQSLGGAYSLQYDGNGNLTGGFGGTYAYTPDNRLGVSTINGGATTQFTYDGDAWRLKKAVTGGTTYYYVRGPNGQLLSEWVNSSPAAVRDYIYAGGRLIGVVSTTAPPK